MKFGITQIDERPVIVTALEGNVASRKTIEACCGVFQEKFDIEGENELLCQYYVF
ncbi:MAG: hypothetical protein LBN08_05880 [Lactobacillales bacterium]|nr:hypothetical protein [Lactobacillales bacterium]